MTMALTDLTAAMLTAARAAGADAADAIAIRSTSISVEVRGGKLDEAQRAEGIDLGLRVFIGQCSAIVSSSDQRPATLARMAERAVAMAREAPPDPTQGLADPGQLGTRRDYAALDLCDPGPEPDAASLQQAALTAEAAAMAVPGVTQMESSGAGHGRYNVALAATNGLSVDYSRTDFGLSATAISGTGTGMERDYDYDSRLHRADLRDAQDIGHSAGMRAAAMQGARRPATGTYPVLFDERVAASLIGHLLGAINGSAIARGSSWLRGAMGQQVLPAALSLTEDPHLPRRNASRWLDAEGLPTQRRQIVADGVLTTWTLDLATGRKLGLASTANAARSAGSAPSPSVTNIALTQGTASKADLLGQMGTGLLVTQMIGSTINPNTGDYSRGAAGFWVEQGQITHPVNEITIAGNLRDMLGRIVPANDARTHLGRVVPSLLIDAMVIAGG